MKKYIDKAKTLVEAMPYITEFFGKTIVIKYGGSAMLDSAIKETFFQDVALMKLVGMKPVIVHGGGPEINKALKKSGKVSEFVDGLRVTDQETMEVVEMVLAGKINKEIVSRLQVQGVNAVGICGKDGNLLETVRKYPNGNDVGFVGEVDNVNLKLIYSLMDNDFIPVIAPIGADNEGNSYNINADYAAVAIAGELRAQKLVFLTDVAGVLKDINDSSSLISKLYLDEIPELIKKGIISGGMLPKIECCAEGVLKGVNTVHILDGRIEHSLLLEIFTQQGVGTMIEKSEEMVTVI